MDYVASAERWKVKKPAPRFFQKIVDKLQLEACSIAYVGDRLGADILPALGADMIAVFIRWGPGASSTRVAPKRLGRTCASKIWANCRMRSRVHT